MEHQLRNRSRVFTTAAKAARAVAGLVACGLLAACVADPVTDYTPIQSKKQTEVIWVSMVHDIAFEVGKKDMSDAEEARLDAFLSDIRVSSTDSVVIDPGSFRGGIIEPRVRSVAHYLKHQLPAVHPTVTHLGWEESDEDFRIIVGRYLVIPPECPNLASSTALNPNNLLSSNFGCATETNLALMIANPADLVHGGELQPGDGRLLANGVELYRAGLVQATVSGGEGGGTTEGGSGGETTE
ncbi:MAG: CpaD family pilus assembly lipoprotein [Alphaproteobacteria bacterium]|nr:CpaD family pilus assembly lipoprotein [Alphaproteobacteria bacterium]